MVFDHVSNHVSLGRTQLHDLIIGHATAHVPCHLDTFRSNLVGLLIKLINVFGNFICG